MNWTDFLPIAREIVRATGLLYLGSRQAYMGGGGGGSSKYERKGKGMHYRSYDIPASIRDLVMTNATTAGVDPSIRQVQDDALRRLMSMRPETQSGFSRLEAVASIDPTSFVGRRQLESIASLIDPSSQQYELGTVNAYRRAAGEALSGAVSGPSFVRGADLRPALIQASLAKQLAEGRTKELREARMGDIQTLLQAATGLSQIEAGRLGTVRDAAMALAQLAGTVGGMNLEASKTINADKIQSTQLLQLAAMLTGKTVDEQVDDFYGRGSQENWQAGVSCCFIMYANCRGQHLPWVIELARQEFWTPERRRGYKWMSRFLVPLMKKSRAFNNLIGLVLVRPAIRYCEWFYGGKPFGVVDYIISKFWLGLWSLIGRMKHA